MRRICSLIVLIFILAWSIPSIADEVGGVEEMVRAGDLPHHHLALLLGPCYQTRRA